MRISDWSSDVCSSDLLVFRATLTARNDRAGMAHPTARRGGTPSDETDHRLLASALRLILDELRRFFLGATADLADHDDRFRCIIGQIQFQHIDEVGAVDGIAANAQDRKSTRLNSWGLMHCLLRDRK